MTIALETRSLTKQFGGLTAVNSVDMAIEEHAIFSVIGPNGAGKTTFYNCITGFLRAGTWRRAVLREEPGWSQP